MRSKLLGEVTIDGNLFLPNIQAAIGTPPKLITLNTAGQCVTINNVGVTTPLNGLGQIYSHNGTIDFALLPPLANNYILQYDTTDLNQNPTGQKWTLTPSGLTSINTGNLTMSTNRFATTVANDITIATGIDKSVIIDNISEGGTATTTCQFYSSSLGANKVTEILIGKRYIQDCGGCRYFCVANGNAGNYFETAHLNATNPHDAGSICTTKYYLNGKIQMIGALSNQIEIHNDGSINTTLYQDKPFNILHNIALNTQTKILNAGLTNGLYNEIIVGKTITENGYFRYVDDVVNTTARNLRIGRVTTGGTLLEISMGDDASFTLTNAPSTSPITFSSGVPGLVQPTNATGDYRFKNIPVDPGGNLALAIDGGNAGSATYGRIYAITSSIKNKDIVNKTIPDFESNIELLTGKYYTMKVDTRTPKYEQFGMIAEELNIIPNWNIFCQYNNKEPIAIDYARLSCGLIDVVKRQKTKIAALEATINKIIQKIGPL